MKHQEHDEQTRIIRWADWCPLPEGGKVGDYLFAIPNGGARTAITGALLKAEGVRAGVPDLCLCLPRGGFHGLYIELKAGKGRMSESQKIWQERLRAQQYRAECCYGADEAIALIREYVGV